MKTIWLLVMFGWSNGGNGASGAVTLPHEFKTVDECIHTANSTVRADKPNALRQLPAVIWTFCVPVERP